MIHPARAELALEVSGEELVLFGLEESSWKELARWRRSETGKPELPSTVLSLLGQKERAALVVLPQGDTLSRSVEVPAALSENLQEAIGFELDRYTPYKPDQVYYDAVVLARDEAQQRLSVDIGVVPRERADVALDLAVALGLSPAGLVRALPTGPGPSLEFLPEERRPRPSGLGVWAYGLPALGIGLLGLAALLLPIWQKRDTVRALEPLVNEARLRAEAAEALHRLLLKQQDEYNFLLGRKHTQPMAIEVLDEATRILPDDTWAHLVELKSDPKNPGKNYELQVRGETGISGKLISVFEEAKLFTQTAYKSPVTKGQPGAGDMFHVSAEIKKRPLPEAGEPAIQPSVQSSAQPTPTQSGAAPGASSAASAIAPLEAASRKPPPAQAKEIQPGAIAPSPHRPAP